MTTCFIVQPVHSDGVACLRDAGITVRFASSADMAVVAAEIGDAVAVITRDAGLDARAMAAASGLRVIAGHGVGTNRIDLPQAKRRGIMVVNTPDTNIRSVAEYTIGLMFAVARRITEADRAVRAGNWGFRYQGHMAELHGKSLGLVGFGQIARLVASMARAALDMEVAVWSPNVPDDIIRMAGVRRADTLHGLLAMSDVVSLHRPLRPDTVNTIDDAALRAIRPGAMLINTGRGGLVDIQALNRALRDGRLGGAALDVFAREPPATDDPVLAMPRVVLSPHIAGATEEAMRATAVLCATQIIDCLNGRTPAHPVTASPT
ncbi:hydroxyacid dehydrogenase [Gluconacetobacter azotocaptans]|uniref:Hydroxyacid dehydrogenase n=1 Tax=Gluconacetobacter azotocaptans TaxID=142834 RepID=A0A7W4JSY6_9PROT|nr:hydroxyacid dehydrogenase [Gluconacetobacter azotocaptans]MBB2190282.1 hydroxyacid dehydrogenase [Gluconacetobacter azotocaptans]MBM9400684.1 hydroxyacid dehydrogenase [Gluconacetobacter azotocaptans]GBQ27379.1 D-3-phosphoglycerate dehydrogenase [Gluconacetobacter azotocaptans DSM 13594]